MKDIWLGVPAYCLLQYIEKRDDLIKKERMIKEGISIYLPQRITNELIFYIKY